MAQAELKTSGRELAPNAAEPTGLLLGEAFMHLAQNRIVQLASSWWMIVFEIAAVVGAFLYDPYLTFGLTVGVIAVYLSVVIMYLCWYGSFINRNRSYKPLCPNCTSRMWQLCCKRCREPVPALALWLWGIFLAHCPHCGFSLSCHKETLLAWCSTCAGGYPRPDHLYYKPTHVIVWIATTLPDVVGGGWERLPNREKHEMALYHKGDGHSSSFMYIRDDYQSREMPVREHLINHTRLLLISSDVPPAHAEHIKGYFDKSSRTICETVEHG